MLFYPNLHSPTDSMAQLVPCSTGSLAFPISSTDGFNFNGHQAIGSSALTVDAAVTSPLSLDGQTVPSSPTFSTWNNSPPSYWSDCSPVNIKSEPQAVTFASPAVDSSLEELLNDFTYGEYSPFRVEDAKPLQQQPQQHSESQGHALLRQCLRTPAPADYCHLQFLDHIGSAIASLPGPMEVNAEATKPSFCNWATPAQQQQQQQPSSTAQGLASVLSLVMEQVNEEVRSTCEILGVSPNPSQWSADDVHKWLLWTSRQCASGPFPFERFQMEGAALTALTEEEFRFRAPQGGDTIYAKLDIWRTAWNRRSAVRNAFPTAPSSAPAPPVMVPTIQVEEPVDQSVDDLFAWINTPQDLQAPNSLLSTSQPHHSFLTVPSPASTSSHRGALSPYSDHTHSGSEDMASEVEEIDDEEDDDMTEGERAASSASSRGASRAAGSPNGSHIHLWQFLKELLGQPAVHGSAIRWLDRQRGVFKIEDSVRVARLWGKRKNRPAMNYDKLSRSIRQYYRKGIMKKTERSQRLVYQFCHPYAL